MKYPNLGCDSILLYKLHNSLSHILTTLLSFELLYPNHKRLQAVVFGHKLNREAYYTQVI